MPTESDEEVDEVGEAAITSQETGESGLVTTATTIVSTSPTIHPSATARDTNATALLESPSSSPTFVIDESSYLLNGARAIPQDGSDNEPKSIVPLVSGATCAALVVVASVFALAARRRSGRESRDVQKEAVFEDIAHGAEDLAEEESGDESSGSFDVGNVEISLEGNDATSSPHMVVVSDIGGFPRCDSENGNDRCESQRRRERRPYELTRTTTSQSTSSVGTDRTPLASDVSEWLNRTWTSETDATPIASNVTTSAATSAGAPFGTIAEGNEDDADGCSDAEECWV